MSIKSFLMKKMIKSKMKGVPDAEVDRLMAMVEKNPDFFKKIADEIEKETKSGRDQMSATMLVMKRHQDEVRKLMM